MIIIDGNGSEFIMHGRMQPFTLDHCQNITLKNFTVDWDIPLTAQGTVTESTPDFMEIEIDACQYPYIIETNIVVADKMVALRTCRLGSSTISELFPGNHTLTNMYSPVIHQIYHPHFMSIGFLYLGYRPTQQVVTDMTEM